MGWRFNRRIKICKGLYLNVGKKGVSTSVKLGNVTFNSKGTVTTSIPGTGFSYRTNLNKKGRVHNQVKQIELRNNKNRYIYFFLTLFFGFLGFHKFYINEYKWGIVYMLTMGLFVFGWIIDIIKAIKLIIKGSSG